MRSGQGQLLSSVQTDLTDSPESTEGEKDILSFSIYKRSVDARKEVSFIYSVLLSLKEEEKLLRYPDVSVYEEKDLSARKVSSSMRPVIIGYGPSGIFAAWRQIGRAHV